MSRAYQMMVEIEKFDAEKGEAIKSAAEEEWDFEDWYSRDGRLISSGQSSLCGGETEEDFAGRLARAIWKANGKYCEVTVNATYLEEIPYETHSPSEETYERLKAQGQLD